MSVVACRAAINSTLRDRRNGNISECFRRFGSKETAASLPDRGSFGVRAIANEAVARFCQASACDLISLRPNSSALDPISSNRVHDHRPLAGTGRGRTAALLVLLKENRAGSHIQAGDCHDSKAAIISSGRPSGRWKTTDRVPKTEPLAAGCLKRSESGSRMATELLDHTLMAEPSWSLLMEPTERRRSDPAKLPVQAAPERVRLATGPGSMPDAHSPRRDCAAAQLVVLGRPEHGVVVYVPRSTELVLVWQKLG